ncbi:Arabinofuranosyltransferase AftA [Corynebacterium freiburgense]|nr:galactan 5-O-arabinofuranosyltransferase [Corynebacterium freiburgense]WJZ01389.1 Arabinofuranosyltransferase AftA [Corynebacterium freiburgense]
MTQVTAREALDLPVPATEVPFTKDLMGDRATVFSVLSAGVGGALFTLVCWFVLKQTNLPAFGSSEQLQAIATAGTFAVLVVVGVLSYLWTRDNTKRWLRWLTLPVSYLAPAALVVTTTAIPLSATRLYLDGVTVDQGFRTQFLTRLTDSPVLDDMNYIDMPSFYPGGWFWLGGRFSAFLGLPGWEGFQPWALVSISAAACIVVPVWQRICGSLPVATGIGLVSICIALVVTAEEPYAAIVALGVPAASVLAYRAVAGHKLAIAGMIIYLGISASMYTLYTVTIALSVILIATVFAVFVQRSWRPIIRLIIVGLGSMVVAAPVWTPYLLAVLRGDNRSGATAMHYLPYEGTQIPLPMLSFSFVGGLCLLGLLFLMARAVDPDVRSMGIALFVFYCWIVASMIATLAGNTLLGFRLDSIVALQLTTAGVLAVADIRLFGISRLYPVQLSDATRSLITACLILVTIAAGLGYAQTIPKRNEDAINLAYSNTDGYGERADRYPADSAQYYKEINEILTAKGFVPRETVVLTDEQNFMSYYPYRGFQAFTSHYANPLGEFDSRNEQIEQWAKMSWQTINTPKKFSESLADSPWKTPDVFIFRGDRDKGYKYDIAEDIYPNNPNVRFRGVFFNPEVFSTWDVTQVGPFIVVTRENERS